MSRSRIALFIAAIILASSYSPGQAVFAKEPLTASDSVAMVAANGRYGTFDSNLSLLPGGQYCYKISISNLDAKAAERYIYVALPRYFKNLPEEYVPKLVKIKNLPKSKLPRYKGDFTDEYAVKIKIEKNREDFRFPVTGQLPTGKFTQSGGLETSEVIRLDLTGLTFKKGTHDIHFIFEAPEYMSLPVGLHYAKHSFYIYEKNGDTYTLAAATEQFPEVRYVTLSEAVLSSPDSLDTANLAVTLQPGDFYNYRVMVKRPALQEVENRFLLVALPAFYETAGKESTPYLSPEAGLTVTGLSTDRPPLSFSTVTLQESTGDAAWLPFKSAALEEYMPSVTLMKFDLSSLTFIDEEAFFDFYFQVPPYAPLDAYPADIAQKDKAIHGFALYEFNKNGDLLYKSSLEEGVQAAHIKQSPLVRSVPPFLLQAVDSLYYDGKARGRASVESRRLEVLPGSEYLYKIVIEKIESPEGFQNDLYIALPQGASLETDEVSTVGLDLDGAISAEEDGIRIDLNKARFTANTAVLTLAFNATASDGVVEHNFTLISNGPEGEKYIVTNEEEGRVRVALLPPPQTEITSGIDMVESAVFFGEEPSERMYSGAISSFPDSLDFSGASDAFDRAELDSDPFDSVLNSSNRASAPAFPQRALLTVPTEPETSAEMESQLIIADDVTEDDVEEKVEGKVEGKKVNPPTKNTAPSFLLFLSLIVIFLYCLFELKRRISITIK